MPRRRQLRGFKESLAKVRTAVHKIFPRELSPTRLAEKYGSDAKKKGAKKLAAVGTVSEAKNAAADELLARQLETIRAAVPQSTLLPFTTSAPKTPPALVVAPATDYVPWIIGGGFALAAAIILFRGKRP